MSDDWASQLGDSNSSGDTSGGEMSMEDKISALTSDALSVDEAAEKDYIWRILLWSTPGKGKTHFAFTMPEPICFVDTENKADSIAHKFDDRNIHLWQPSGFDEAQDALENALSLLRLYYDETGERGTIVVDSMSVMWELAQRKHAEVSYPGDDFEEAKKQFQGSFTKGPSDWAKIKQYHNAGFRDKMTESDFHLCWTAMQTKDYEEIIGNEKKNVFKPDGESRNKYRATDIINMYEENNSVIGILQKSGLTRFRYDGLVNPTFDDHENLVREIEEQELKGVDPEDMEFSYDVSIITGKSKFVEEEDE